MCPSRHPGDAPIGRDAPAHLSGRNRALLRLEHALRRTRHHRTFAALLVIDADEPGKAGKLHGNAAANQVLQAIAGQLTATVRDRDLVVRSSRCEFMVVLDGLGAPLAAAAHHALQVAEKLRLCIAEQVPGLTAGIGVTLLRATTASVDAALEEARVAARRAREQGGNRIVFHDHALQDGAERRQWLERDLPLALDTPQMSLQLQPQLGVAGEVTGAELLARWRHPLRGDVPPSQFIPLAEETGWIDRLGARSLHTACATLAVLQRLGEPYPLSVNVSPARIMNPGFVAAVRETLEATGAPGDRLIFEITEGLLIQDMQAVATRMQALARLGIRFSIDDFGTGYSNLASLRRLPLHELKIDRSLVQDLPHDPDSAAIVQLILGMAHRLGLRVVAEGVETQGQADFLFANQCDALQGFLLAPPTALAAWLEQIRSRNPDPAGT